MKLRAQATLSTRPAKEVHSLADLTAEWRERASRVLGHDVSTLAGEASSPVLLRAEDLPREVVDALGVSVMTAVSEKRATWRHWNLTAEAARQTMPYRFASASDREAVVGLIVDAAQRASLRLTPPELAVSPVEFQRHGGTSVFRPKHSVVFTSTELLDAESRLLERAALLTAPRVTLGLAARTRLLAMNALRRAWEAAHGAGSVVGLAPSAAAARVLATDLGIATENLAKWWQIHVDQGSSFRAGQLVIIDEASLAGTLPLDRITALALEAGAKVLLVGNYAQLQSVDAGGAFSLLVHDRADAPELIDVHRFAHEWEKSASLGLRQGHPDVIDLYAVHDRLRDGSTEAVTRSSPGATIAGCTRREVGCATGIGGP
jgi:hypothetical protein